MSPSDFNRLAKADWSAKTKISPGPTEGKPFQLEVRGTFGVRVVDARAFKASMSEAGASTPGEIQRALEKMIKERFNSMIRRSLHTTEEVETHFGDVAVETRLGVKQQFSRMGLDLVDFLVTSIRSSGSSKRSVGEGPERAPRRSTATLSRPRVGRAEELKFPRRRD